RCRILGEVLRVGGRNADRISGVYPVDSYWVRRPRHKRHVNSVHEEGENVIERAIHKRGVFGRCKQILDEYLICIRNERELQTYGIECWEARNRFQGGVSGTAQVGTSTACI